MIPSRCPLCSERQCSSSDSAESAPCSSSDSAPGSCQAAAERFRGESKASKKIRTVPPAQRKFPRSQSAGQTDPWWAWSHVQQLSRRAKKLTHGVACHRPTSPAGSGGAVQRRIKSQYNRKDSNRTADSGAEEVCLLALAVGRTARRPRRARPLAARAAAKAAKLLFDAADTPPEDSCRGCKGPWLFFVSSCSS